MSTNAIRHPHTPLSRLHPQSFAAPANPVGRPLILQHIYNLCNDNLIPPAGRGEHTPSFMLTHASQSPDMYMSAATAVSLPDLTWLQISWLAFPFPWHRARCNIWSVGRRGNAVVKPPQCSDEFTRIGSSARCKLQHGLWPVSPDGLHCVNEQRWSIEDIRSMSVILNRGPLAAIETQLAGCPNLICLR